ncbi:MAG: GNAT family N-acetyltransferase [Candidatus Dormibacter sp.]
MTKAQRTRSARLTYRRATIDDALRLVQEPVSIDGLRAGGYPDEGTRFFALRLLERGTDDTDIFGMYHVIDAATGALVGHVGFHGRPDDDHAVRIGYAIARDVRGQGHAQEAVSWIIDLALTQPVVELVRADTTQCNLRSQHVLERTGFALVRSEAGIRFYQYIPPRQAAAG